MIKQLQDMLLLYGNKIILTISDGENENEYDIKSITGKPCAKYFEPKDKVAEVTITVKPTVEAITKDQYEARLKAEKIAMLTELKAEIEEIKPLEPTDDEDYEHGCFHGLELMQDRCLRIVQQKINSLKENTDGD